MQRCKNNARATFDAIIVRPGGAARRHAHASSVPPTFLFFDDADCDRHELPRLRPWRSAERVDIDVTVPLTCSSSPAFSGPAQLAGAAARKRWPMRVASLPTRKHSLARVAVCGLERSQSKCFGRRSIGKTINQQSQTFRLSLGACLKSRGAGPAGNILDNVVPVPINTLAPTFNREVPHPGDRTRKAPDAARIDRPSLPLLLRDPAPPASSPRLDVSRITNPAATMGSSDPRGQHLNQNFDWCPSVHCNCLRWRVVIMVSWPLRVSERAPNRCSPFRGAAPARRSTASSVEEGYLVFPLRWIAGVHDRLGWEATVYPNSEATSILVWATLRCLTGRYRPPSCGRRVVSDLSRLEGSRIDFPSRPCVS